jgi:hypothetical protein
MRKVGMPSTASARPRRILVAKIGPVAMTPPVAIYSFPIQATRKGVSSALIAITVSRSP